VTSMALRPYRNSAHTDSASKGDWEELPVLAASAVGRRSIRLKQQPKRPPRSSWTSKSCRRWRIVGLRGDTTSCCSKRAAPISRWPSPPSAATPTRHFARPLTSGLSRSRMTVGSHPSSSAGSGQLRLIGGNAFASVRVYDSASLLLERRALSRGLAEVSAISAQLVPVGEGQGGGVFSKAQDVRYTAIARRPAAQGKSTAHSACATFATPDTPPLASWGAGALAGTAPVFSIAISVTVSTPRL